MTINSRQTREALRLAKALFEEAMDREVLGWDGSANNLFIISGKGSWIMNPISSYVTARKDNPKVGNQIGLTLLPRGPAGRFQCATVLSNGIWQFSKVQGVARQFLRDFYTTAYKDAFLASEGYNFPVLSAPFSKPPMPLFDRDPELAVIPKQAEFARTIGHPGLTTAPAEAVYNQWVLNDMFAKVATGTPIDEAVLWGEAEIKQIYARR